MPRMNPFGAALGALSLLTLAVSAGAAHQMPPGQYRADWPQAPFAVPMWLVQCTGSCPGDGLYLVANPQAIPAGSVRVLGGPYNHGGDLFLARPQLLQAGLPPGPLRVEILDGNWQRIDGLVLAEPAELGRMAAQARAMATGEMPRAPGRNAPQVSAGVEDDDVIRSITPSEAGRAAGPLVPPEDPAGDEVIVAMTPSEASRAQARIWNPEGPPDQGRPIRSMTFSEASREAERLARAEGAATQGQSGSGTIRSMTFSEASRAAAAGPGYPWDTLIRIHGIECFNGRHIEVHTDHYHHNGRFMGVDRADYDRARAGPLGRGEQFCGAWETRRETIHNPAR